MPDKLAVLQMSPKYRELTAEALAEELEVSVRTIYRDLDALRAAGVPVYAERGPGGGCALLDSYRTTLTGLTALTALAIHLAAGAATRDLLGFGFGGVEPTFADAAAIFANNARVLAAVLVAAGIPAGDWLVLERRIESLISTSPWAREVGRLRCLRGIDTLTAVGLCAEIGDFARIAAAGMPSGGARAADGSES